LSYRGAIRTSEYSLSPPAWLIHLH